MESRRLVRILKKWLPWGLAVLCFIVYLFTLCPSVNKIDAGELAAVQYTGGIAHPTGYPLFTILGFLFSKIPMGISKIVQLNMLSAVFCAVGVAFFAKAAIFLLDQIVIRRKRKQPDGKEITEEDRDNPGIWLLNLLAVSAGSAILAFSRTFWAQSASVEVYSLHILLVGLVFFFTLKAHFSSGEKSGPWMLLAGSVALAFTNHMTTIMLVPGVALVFVSYLWREHLKTGQYKTALIKVIKMLGVSLGILLVLYAYLPVRAMTDPALNWGNPVDWPRFYRHVSGAQYSIWLFSSTEVAKENLEFFFMNLGKEFLYFPLALSVPGLIFLFKRFRVLAFFTLTLLVFCIGYAIFYNIHDLDSYFLLAYIVIGFWSLLGVKQVLSWIKRGRVIKTVLAVSFLLAGLGVLLSNFSVADQRKETFYGVYTEASLEGLPQNSIMIGFNWDCQISPSYYYQHVEGFRPDLTIIDSEMLTNRIWYFDQMETNRPALAAKLQPKLEQFKSALIPFEEGDELGMSEVAALQNGLLALFQEIIKLENKGHPVFLAPEFVHQKLPFFTAASLNRNFRLRREQFRGALMLPEGYSLVPDAYFFRVTHTEGYVTPSGDRERVAFPQKELERYQAIPQLKEPLWGTQTPLLYGYRYPEAKSEWKKDADYIGRLRYYVPRLWTERARYELYFKKEEEGKAWIRRIRQEFPEYRLPPDLTSLSL